MTDVISDDLPAHNTPIRELRKLEIILDLY